MALRRSDGTPSPQPPKASTRLCRTCRSCDDLVIDGPRVEFHWTFTGTNTGPGGTGKAVHISGYEEWTIDDGLIARSLGHYDAAEYARQLAERV